VDGRAPSVSGRDGRSVVARGIGRGVEDEETGVEELETSFFGEELLIRG
jgi:hypothetical protein